MSPAPIRVGIGGWTFEPWRGVFYPKGHVQAKELDYAARQVTVIEINGTYYSMQKPASFAKWARATPDDFVFTVKASRFCTNRKVLAGAGDAIARFMGQGLAELGPKLGPILWQFMPTKAFDADDFRAFLQLLPPTLGTMTLRHAVEVRHDSFKAPEFIDLVREAGVAVVCADSAKYPMIADLTANFVYTRLQNAEETEMAGYAEPALDHWAATAKAWAKGAQPLKAHTASPVAAPVTPRDVFVFMINGAKIRAPAAATALLKRL